METQKEKNNKVIAAATTIGMYAVLFLLFFFTVAWRAPYPPIPGGGGIEVNFGLDDQGFGDIQPDVPVGTEQPQQKKEETAQNEQPKQEEQEPEEKLDDKELATSTEESPVTVKKDDTKKKDVKTEPVKPVDNPVKEKETPKKEEPKPQTVYNPNKDATTGTNDKEGKPGNHGDDPGTTGDKGDPKGSLDAKALYGNQGNGNGEGNGSGPGLSLAGWNWDEIPKPVIPSNETGGRVVFEIKVDGDGEIISIVTLERVSLEAEKACRKEIEKLTFTKTGTNVPAVSTGKITFVVRSN